MANNEILREFLLETHENLALLDTDLVRLETHPTEKETLAQVFRTLHSVKGTAGFMGLVKLQAVAHAAENLLSRLRAGEILFNPPIATALLQVVDAIREILSHIEASGEEGPGEYSDLAAEVNRLRETGGLEPTPGDVLKQSMTVEQPSGLPPLGSEPSTAPSELPDSQIALPSAGPELPNSLPGNAFAKETLPVAQLIAQSNHWDSPETELNSSDAQRIARNEAWGTTPSDVLTSPMPQLGTPIVQIGTPIVQSGTPIVQSGTPIVQSGTPIVQSGTPIAQSGTPIAQSGTPIGQSGTPIGRQGTPISDQTFTKDHGMSMPGALSAEIPRQAESAGQTAGMPASSLSLAGSTPTSDSAVVETGEVKPSTVADAAIRVDVGLLDKLMTLVGELVLARNQILQYSDSQEESGFLGAVQRLNLLTTELQASVMKTRMQPIGNVLGKFPRVVRDLAIACGKKVRFEMDGQDTELDKTLIEAIRDPLTHMIRNAIDHGIEPPAERKSRGKAEEGRLRMVAFHEGGKVIIEVSDDGGGIDVNRVREKAIANKLVAPDVAARMSRQDLLRLIFLPGFSTAERVTQFSGRGVGMDVVRTNIEKIGGTVDLESSLGQGTTIRTKIPLTLAIIPALIIVSGGERYAIPQVSLLELVRLDAEHARTGIERLHGAPVYRLRGTLLPLVFLDEQLKLAATRGEQDDLNIIVLQADDRPFGLVVDAIRDTEEIVVKPLQKQLKGIPVFAGAAIMGDGRVALVLDVVGLAQRASVISGAKGRSLSEQERPASAATGEIKPLLLFSPSAGGQMAIPLSQVARLEEFPRSRLETLGARQVVQYRGEILPLLDVSQELERLQRGGHSAGSSASRPGSSGGEPAESDAVPVVVYADGEQRVGLIVGRILDIVHENIETRSHGNRPGALFTAVVQEKVTEFIDVATLVRALQQDFVNT